MKRSSVFILSVFVQVILLCMPVYAASWKQDDGGWWYENDNGSFPKNNWQLINGKWYYFDGNGYMMTGWIQQDGSWYFLGADGAMYADAATPDGYYVDASGRMTDGEEMSDMRSVLERCQTSELQISFSEDNYFKDCGNYYEVKGKLSCWFTIPSSKVEGKKKGDKITLEGKYFGDNKAQTFFITKVHYYPESDTTDYTLDDHAGYLYIGCLWEGGEPQDVYGLRTYNDLPVPSLVYSGVIRIRKDAVFDILDKRSRGDSTDRARLVATDFFYETQRELAFGNHTWSSTEVYATFDSKGYIVNIDENWQP